MLYEWISLIPFKNKYKIRDSFIKLKWNQVVSSIAVFSSACSKENLWMASNWLLIKIEYIRNRRRRFLEYSFCSKFYFICRHEKIFLWNIYFQCRLQRASFWFKKTYMIEFQVSNWSQDLGPFWHVLKQNCQEIKMTKGRIYISLLSGPNVHRKPAPFATFWLTLANGAWMINSTKSTHVKSILFRLKVSKIKGRR